MLFNEYIHGKLNEKSSVATIKSKANMSSYLSKSNRQQNSSTNISTTNNFHKNNHKLLSSSLENFFSRSKLETFHSLRKSLKEKRKLRFKDMHKTWMRDNLRRNMLALYEPEDKPKIISSREKEISPDILNEHHTSRSMNSSASGMSKLSIRLNELLSSRYKHSHDFAKNCSKLCTAKVLMNVQREVLTRYQETYDSRVSELKDTMRSLNQNKEMLKNKFIPAMGRFIKILDSQRESEMNEKEMTYLIKMNYEKDIAKLLTKIFKLKKTIEKYMTYRNLLICVKEKRTKLPWHFIYQVEEELEPMEKLLKDFESKFHRRSSTFMGRFMSCAPLYKFSSIIPQWRRTGKILDNNDFILSGEALEEFNRYSSYLNPCVAIFSSVESFCETMKAYEARNFDLLCEYNQLHETISQTREELNKSQNEYNHWENMNNALIQSKENILRELNIRNMQLKSEFEKLLVKNMGYINFNKLFEFSANYQNFKRKNKDTKKRHRWKIKSVLSTSPKDIAMIKYQSLKRNSTNHTNSPTNLTIIFNKIYQILSLNFNYNFGMKMIMVNTTELMEVKCIKLLTYLEHEMDALFEKYYETIKKTTSPKKKKIEEEILLQGKLSKQREYRKFVEDRREQIKSEIFENSSNIIFQPRRKVAESYSLGLRAVMGKKDKKKSDEKESDYVELISYSENEKI